MADTRIERLRVAGRDAAFGIGEAAPHLSWRVATDEQGWTQHGYELAVDDRSGWRTTGRVDASDSIAVAWPFAPLRSRERREVRVRVWGPHDEEPSAWSDPVAVETGLLHADDWQARYVSPAQDEGGPTPRPAYLLRRTVDLTAPIVLARVYATALGIYELQINGQRIGDQELAPGWTSYHHRLRYQTYDVTDELAEGSNTIGAVLADGWFRGRVGFAGGVQDLYGDRTALYLQLEVEHPDGSTTLVATDDDWASAPSPITSTGLYEGERHDARLEDPGWCRPGAAAQGWEPVRVLETERPQLVAPSGPPVRAIERRDPVHVGTSPSGATIVDFGQNLVGRVRFRVQGPAGTTVVLHHAEVLEHDELALRALRHATARDEYVLRGEGVEEWEPRFATHGFRYVQVDGWPGELDLGDLHAVVLHTDLERTGWFACSDPLVEQLHDNVVWSMRGNFVDIPTDCPQRDERLGWTGDLQVFTPTAAFLFDVAPMLGSWLDDLAAEQRELGTVPVYVPWVPHVLPATPAAAWGDAAVIVPWVLYERTGDRAALERAYPSMVAWVEQLAELRSHRGLWEHGFQFGDWLDPTAPPDDPAAARTDPSFVATAYLIRSADLGTWAAHVLGRDDDADRMRELADEARVAFAREFVSPGGRIVSDSQTAAALLLRFDLSDDPQVRARTAERLRHLVQRGGHRIGTGFVGTPLVCDALTDSGALDTAYHLLLQRTCPSWLYPVTMGATTTWERWDSMLPDGSINPGEMTSFNHYALGAVADWLHRVVAGLAPTAPGYATFAVAPRPGGGLSWARAAHETPFGRAEVAWERTDGRLAVDVLVPPTTSATVSLPAGEDGPVTVGSGRHRFSCPFPPPDADPDPPERGLP